MSTREQLMLASTREYYSRVLVNTRPILVCTSIGRFPIVFKSSSYDVPNVAISSHLWYFCTFYVLLICVPPVDPAVPPVLNSWGGITYFDKWESSGVDSTWLSVADNQVKTLKI